MKKTYEKPKIVTTVINTETIANESPLSAASLKQSQYSELNLTSRTIVNY